MNGEGKGCLVEFNSRSAGFSDLHSSKAEVRTKSVKCEVHQQKKVRKRSVSC